ncbi:MAG: hypothetical protein CMO61_09405 [Verrucomicrobiales bacterium]|nr:hypothetical protein [Verrucomicrobiales bacterium]|tara:strand:+ start:2296 stop:4326 length:2031 start_codon:yes stop_codon:yes gene_type:complete
MKTQTPLFCRNRNQGYATVAIVAAVAMILISMMTYSLVGNLTSLESQVGAQIKQDYSQKEDAVLSALLHVVPNKAIGAMQQGSAANADNYTWEKIFEEAINLANAEQAADATIISSLTLGDAITANTGDTNFDSMSDFVGAAESLTWDNSTGNLVNGGNWYEYRMLINDDLKDGIPAPLRCDYDYYLLDKEYPLITFEKLHVYNYNSFDPLYYKGLNANTDSFPLYNLYEYPDVKLGYKRPGDNFVAKRNWWTFALTFGEHNSDATGVPPTTKNYVLSIYEVPSQLPISASTSMSVGQFSDGGAWENVSLQGGLYADSILTQGTVALSEGSISARKSVSLGDSTSVGGNTLSATFDALGDREERALLSESDFYDASVAGNVGKVAFIPINPGYDFLKLASDGLDNERISPTGWNEYCRGAEQARMRVEIREMFDVDDQVPVSFRFHYFTNSNSREYIDYTRGINWPSEIESGGGLFPFQTDTLENGRNVLVVNVNRMADFLDTIPNAAGSSVNNSLYLYPNSDEATVIAPSIPSLETDLAVTLRGGKDLTAFTTGFSILTDMRLYIAESLNDVAATPPVNSNLPAGSDYYPPLSIFTPEKRFGEVGVVNTPVNLRGQISSLKTSASDTFNPLELMGADDTRVDTDLMNAELVHLNSPAELPPIHLMNWLITIEEIH